MKALSRANVSLIALLSIVCTSAFTDDSGNWNPAVPNTSRFEDLERDLMGAAAFLYLTLDCKVVALVVPEGSKVGDYLPSADKIKRVWANRARKYLPNPGNACTAAAGSMTFLAADNLTNPGQPDPCDPNKNVNESALPGITCGVKHSEIDAVIVLDEDFDPLVILRKQLARSSASYQVPATFLGRKEFTHVAPCSPTVPSPCPLPRTGQTKLINGQQVCVCSL